MLQTPQEAQELHQHVKVVDFHAHPSNKVYLFNKKLAKRNRAGGAFNPFAMRVDLPKAKAGGLDLIVSSIYLPEKGLLDDCWALRLLSYVAPRKWRHLVTKNPFEQTNLMLDELETAFHTALSSGIFEMEIARSFTDLERILKSGKMGLLHTIEGGHSLDGKVENLQKFYDRGVCMLTLAHFYANALIYPTDAVPRNMKLLWCFGQEKDLEKGLTTLGKEVLAEMLRLGMIVDLTHATPRARADVYRFYQEQAASRPLVASHVGVQKLFFDPYNLDDDEIKMIAGTGGVVGIILYNHWLNGTDDKYGLPLVVKTARHLKKVGGIDCIAIGSDFDGFTDPPDDVKDPSLFPKITRVLLEDGFSESEVEKIMGGNVLRVLQDGWGKQE